ncbi:AAA family ATPase [Aeromonas allosaccharophila]|uniref:ATP-dependent nuclease n=1 Tax=Aeromonas allosaccharophila TaxID=656 RepID=UPI001BCD64B1|nr:AAA family ATPase [Aeromonas allosaccharophila]MBS4694219.1 AAA family ATPase [Aeromonas allosaccharophila]
MQIRQLRIRNFRGIAALDWAPGESFCCLIGSGDTGKSSILDAIEATLSPRWFVFAEPDFHCCDSANPIIIEATIGELSRQLKSDERFGLYTRGWTRAGELRDEPEDDDEAVLTVRLTVDATLEPVWELVCERLDQPRTLSNRDRMLFGLVRLAGEDSRHLAWGQGSVLSRLTGDTDGATARLAQAYRAARDSAQLNQIESLTNAANQAEVLARSLGAYVNNTYEPGLELGRSGISSGAIALHDNGVPLRLAGLGSRRLATLAIQKSAMSEGAIVIVDEIEHGLEPHRIIGAIAQLKADQREAHAENGPIGHVLMTTHSDVALGEVGANSLYVCQIGREDRVLTVVSPSAPIPIQALLRHTPRALFAKKILVVEGMTEVGLLLGIREFWPERHNQIPIEQLGSAIANGNGAEAVALAVALSNLGYPVALFRDSDIPLTDGETAELEVALIPVFEYGHMLNTEQAIIYAASDEMVQHLLEHIRNERGVDPVNDSIFPAIPGMSKALVAQDFSTWELNSDFTAQELRERLAGVVGRKKWFKDSRISRDIAPIVWSIATADVTRPLARTFTQVEEWLYA